MEIFTMISVVNPMVSLFYTTKMLVSFIALILMILAVIIPGLFLMLKLQYAARKKKNPSAALRVAFFHPYCNAGGGGEKVLWVAVQALQKTYPTAEFYIYTGDIAATPGEILAKSWKNLNVKLDEKSIKFIYLNKRRWVEADTYSYFTLLGQSLGSIYLGFEALSLLIPDIFIDTTGYPFTLPLFKYIGGCSTSSYVHYPTITIDMIRRVSSRKSIYNNRSFIARSPFFTAGKLLYYRVFAWLYYLAGQCSDITLVNSTFTLEHLNNLWNRHLHLVYPPCEVDHLKTIPRDNRRPEKIRILSLSQFRPEKDHPLQLQALYELREIIPEELFNDISLILCGSCRNTDDSNRVKDLKDLTKHLSLENNVEFRVNITYEELLKELDNGYIGIHTMLDEHFGISVVELLAAGIITIGHRSGGPLLDIIETSEGSRLGFLAVTAEDYAHTIKEILYTDDGEIEGIRERARASVDRFSTKKFQEEFLRAVKPLFN